MREERTRKGVVPEGSPLRIGTCPVVEGACEEDTKYPTNKRLSEGTGPYAHTIVGERPRNEASRPPNGLKWRLSRLESERSEVEIEIAVISGHSSTIN